LDLNEPRLNRDEQCQVLAELVLLVVGEIIDALQGLFVREEDLKGHEHATVLISVDIHSDLVPEVAQLGTHLFVVVEDLVGVTIFWPLRH